MRVYVLIEPSEDGGYTVTVPRESVTPSDRPKVRNPVNHYN